MYTPKSEDKPNCCEKAKVYLLSLFSKFTATPHVSQLKQLKPGSVHLQSMEEGKQTWESLKQRNK